MKKVKIYIYIVFVTITGFSTAQEIDFAPLQVGNVWVYKHQSGLLLRGEVADSALLIDSIKYYGLAEGYYGNDRALRLTEDNFFVMREDTTLLEPNHERKYYKKNAQLGDSWEVDYGFTFPAVYTIIDTFPANTFDTLVTGKMLNENFGLVEWDYIWTEEFGQLAALDWLGEPQYYSKGCVIDGIVFGDTSFIIVDVKNELEPVNTLVLEQNYPNPFNPTTKIKFTIPTLPDRQAGPPASSPLLKGRTEEGFVTLKLYDVLGNEIAALINEEKRPGSYEIKFNAANYNMPSGVYFYQLKAGEFIQSKKMIFLK